MHIGRREFLVSAGLTAPALAVTGKASAKAASQTAASGGDDRLRAGEDSLTRTAHGHVRGYWRHGVHCFKGLPYAGAPVGEHRFARAPTLSPWTEVRNAFTYGPVCPRSERPADEAANEWPFLLPRGQASAMLEDCLRINVWTRGLADGARRPVMLWLHGQGFMGGSSQDFLATDGENLARTQDVVVASINHRIGPLGYMHLARWGGEYAHDSGNVGMLDIIDALVWLRENAAAFGGDPENITIFGQSGGGFKVSVLLAMPEAKGLFHKAIIQSGARLNVHEPDQAHALAEATFAAAGLQVGDLAGLRALPVAKLLEAVDQATAAVMRTVPPGSDYRHAPRFYWMPVSGVPSLPAQPWDPVAPDVSRDVPIIVGSTTHEAAPAVNNPQLARIDWNGVMARLSPQLGAQTAGVIAAARADQPSAAPVDILAMIEGRGFRLSAAALTRARVAQGGAPVFNYVFAWRTASFEGRPGAFHTADLPFVFANDALVDQVSGGGKRGRLMAERMSGAWAAFARTGRPRAVSQVSWPAASAGSLNTMVFDDLCHVDPQRDARLIAQFA